MDDVIVLAAVLVGVTERPPPRGKGEAAIPTGQVPGVGHTEKHATDLVAREPGRSMPAEPVGRGTHNVTWRDQNPGGSPDVQWR